MDLTFDRSAFDVQHPLASATDSFVPAAQHPVTQLGASDPVRVRTAGSAAAFVGGHWLADDVPDALPQPSAAPSATNATTHVHAITARAAADAAATALLNPMYRHVRTDLYETGMCIACSNLGCCDVRMLQWQHIVTTPSAGMQPCMSRPINSTMLYSLLWLLPNSPSITFVNCQRPLRPCMLHDDALSACKTATRGATTSASDGDHRSSVVKHLLFKQEV